MRRSSKAPRCRRTSLSSSAALALITALATGCATQQYAYLPVSTTTLTSAETTSMPLAQTTPTPGSGVVLPSATDGSVRLVSEGPAKVQGAADGSDSSPSLHLRMFVTNRSADTWTVVGAEQRLEVGKPSGEREAVYALTSQGQRAPIIEVPAGEARVLDLYYPLPSGVTPGKELPQFDAVWSVQAARTPVSERVAFERTAVRPPNTGDVDSRSYMNDPFNAAGTFPVSAPDSAGYPFPPSGPQRPDPRLPNPRPNEDVPLGRIMD